MVRKKRTHNTRGVRGGLDVPRVEARVRGGGGEEGRDVPRDVECTARSLVYR